MAIRKLLSVAVLLSAGLVQVSGQAANYTPAAGDYVEVFRRVFRQADFVEARDAWMKAVLAAAPADGIVRMSIWAENPATGEVLGVQFSDAANRGTWKHKEHMANALGRFETRPAERHEFKIFAVNDEGVVAKAGDAIRFYTSHVKPEAHAQMRDALVTGMTKSLIGNPYKANTYFAESETAGHLVGIGIGEFPSDPRQHRSAVDHLEPHRVKPLQVDAMRIIEVRTEPRK